MVIGEYKPTRSHLLKIKRRIKLSENGDKLLKRKRDGLILEFFKLLKEAKDVRSDITSKLITAEEKIAIAKCVEGVIGVKSAAFALTDNPEIKLESRNVMGIVVPRIEATSVKKRIDERGYGLIGTSVRIDEAAKAYEDLVEDIIISAEIETTMRKLIEEIEKTKRKVNALEYRIIPDLKKMEKVIRLRLEEMERENIFRLKRIKAH